MQENHSMRELKRETVDVKSLSLLPRSAWNSQLSYLKVLLQTKQALDKKIKPKK